MSARQRNKYRDYAECSHRVYNTDVLCYDPYFEQTEDYCGLGRYGRGNDEECRCYNCRHFTLSRDAMKEARALKSWIKSESKFTYRSKMEDTQAIDTSEIFSFLKVD